MVLSAIILLILFEIIIMRRKIIKILFLKLLSYATSASAVVIRLKKVLFQTAYLHSQYLNN